MSGDDAASFGRMRSLSHRHRPQHSDDINVITKMAHKYSQYVLPNADQLGGMGTDSDSDDDKNQSKDDDDAGTMISHQSFAQSSNGSSGNGPHRLTSAASRRQLLANNSNGVPISAEEEMSSLQMDKDLFEKIFDEYLDPSGEGDVDRSEFKKGLQRLGVELSDTQMNELFKVFLMEDGIDMADNDESHNSGAYVDRTQFSDFLSRPFEAATLTSYQNSILTKIAERRAPPDSVDSNKHSLLSAEDAQEWEPAEVNLVEVEMRNAMQQLVDDQMKKLKDKQEWEEELERRAQAPDFAKESSAADWNEYEVAFWVSTVGFDYCMERFYKHEIDGSMLLFDLKPHTIQQELGVKPLHLNKFLRSVQQLRKQAGSVSEMGISDLHNMSIPSESEFQMDQDERISALEQELEQERVKSTSQLSTYISKLESTQQQLTTVQTKLDTTSTDATRLQTELSTLQSRYDTQQKEHSTHLMELTQLTTSQSTQHSEKIEEIISTYEARIHTHDNNNTQRIEELRSHFNAETQRFTREIESLRATIAQKDMQLAATSNATQLSSIGDSKSDSIIAVTSVAPSLSLSSFDKKTSPHSQLNPFLGSSQLESFIANLQTKSDENESFANPKNAENWSCDEVAYWLTRINCKKYVPSFIDQFVDGSILLTDLNDDTLRNDLSVRKIHCGKLNREIDRLKRQLQQLTIETNCDTFIIASIESQSQYWEEMKIQNEQLKNDLATIRARLHSLQTDNDRLQKKFNHNRSSSVTSHSDSPPGKAHHMTVEHMPPASSAPPPGSKTHSGSIELLYGSAARREDEHKTPDGELSHTRSPGMHPSTPGKPVSSPSIYPTASGSTPPPPTEHAPQTWQEYVAYLQNKCKDLNVLIERQYELLRKQMRTLRGQDNNITQQQETINDQQELIAKLQRKFVRERKRRKKAEEISGIAHIGGVDSAAESLSSQKSGMNTIHSGSPVGVSMYRGQPTIIGHSDYSSFSHGSPSLPAVPSGANLSAQASAIPDIHPHNVFPTSVPTQLSKPQRSGSAFMLLPSYDYPSRVRRGGSVPSKHVTTTPPLLPQSSPHTHHSHSRSHHVHRPRHLRVNYANGGDGGDGSAPSSPMPSNAIHTLGGIASASTSALLPTFVGGTRRLTVGSTPHHSARVNHRYPHNTDATPFPTAHNKQSKRKDYYKGRYSTSPQMLKQQSAHSSHNHRVSSSVVDRKERRTASGGRNSSYDTGYIMSHVQSSAEEDEQHSDDSQTSMVAKAWNWAASLVGGNENEETPA